MTLFRVFKILIYCASIIWNGSFLLLLYLLDLLIAIPQLIFAQLNSHKFFITIGTFVTIFLVGVKISFPTMNLFDAFLWLFKSGQFKTKAGAILFFSSLLPSFFLSVLTAPLARFFERIDDSLYGIYYMRLKSIRLSLKSISKTFDLIRFGNYREQELFEMAEFKKMYAPFI